MLDMWLKTKLWNSCFIERQLKSTKQKGKENDPALRREHKEDVQTNGPKPWSGANGYGHLTLL